LSLGGLTTASPGGRRGEWVGEQLKRRVSAAEPLRMNLRLLLIVSLAAAAAVLAAGATAPARGAGINECGRAGTLYGGHARLVNVTTRGVGCRTARRFARGFVAGGSPACMEDRYCRHRGWDCLNYARRGWIDSRCTTGSRVIRWQWR
jgi:hypothetical protein